MLRFSESNNNIREEFMECVVCHLTTGSDIIVSKIKNGWNLPLKYDAFLFQPRDPDVGDGHVTLKS